MFIPLQTPELLKVPEGTAQPVGCAGSPAALGGTPDCKPTAPADISTGISTDTYEERPFGGHFKGSAGADGPAAWSSPWPRMPAGALSAVHAPVKTPGVLLCPYQSARGPSELREDVPHHIPWPAALGPRAEQLPDELQNCLPHLPGESVVTTLLFRTQRICLGAAFVGRREVTRARQNFGCWHQSWALALGWMVICPTEHDDLPARSCQLSPGRSLHPLPRGKGFLCLPMENHPFPKQLTWGSVSAGAGGDTERFGLKAEPRWWKGPLGAAEFFAHGWDRAAEPDSAFRGGTS